MKHKAFLLTLTAALAFGLVSCSKNEPVLPVADGANKTSAPTADATAKAAEAAGAEAAKAAEAARTEAARTAEAAKAEAVKAAEVEAAKAAEAAKPAAVPKTQGLLDQARSLVAESKSTNPSGAAGIGDALTHDQIVDGLKEALAKGVEKAVANLGKEDGFLKDVGVKIPMPESLQKVEKSLRTLRQDKLADEFVTTMNRAAEQAVPEAAAVLGASVKQMSIADARSILTGTNNAATQYFRRTSETNLQTRFLPIVKAATEKTGVTGAYKRMTDKASGGLGGLGALGGSLLGVEAPDIDSYVTRKTIDGLFLKIAEQEKLIRENPVARTTDLLQTVFGSIGK